MASKKRFVTDKSNADPMQLLNKKWLIPKKLLVEDEKISVEMKQKFARLQLGKLQAVSEKNIDRINDVIGIKELLPDINLIKEILVASILNPVDLNEITLSIKSELDIPAEILETIRDHFTTEYNLEAELSTILGEALIDKGAYVLLPIPPSTLYQTMIKQGYSVESFMHHDNDKLEFDNIGLIGVNNSNRCYAMENLTAKIYNPSSSDNVTSQQHLIQISDNPLYLLKSGLLKANQQLKINRYLENHIGMESFSHKHGNDENKLYYRKIFEYVEQVSIKRQNPEEAGKNMNPIIYNLPMESIIPVYVPGEPSNHVGYYVVLDEFSNPVRASKNGNFFRELNKKLEDTVRDGSGNSYIKSTLIGNNELIKGNTASHDLQQPIVDAYIYQIEKELRDAVKNGCYGENVEIARPENVFRLMFSRQLEKQFTRVIYVPAELLTYVAFDYNEMGMGVSLIEKTKLYSSLRAILMFAEIMAGVKNSVPGRILNITLDEVDPDPQGTIETCLQELAAIQSIGLPLGKLNPSDIIEGIQRANIQVKVNGGEVFPNTAIEIEDRKREMTKPDTELSDFLKKQQYCGFGVTPELVDKGLEGEYATSIRASNLLQSKRDMVHQDTFMYWITDHIHKYIFAGGPLYHELKKKWADTKNADDDTTFQDVIESIYTELPRPDTAIITNNATAYEEYSKFIDTVIPVYISEDMLKGMLKGEYTNDVLMGVQNAFSTLLKRQFLRKKNILPEIDENLNIEEGFLSENINEHNSIILQTVAKILPVIYKMEYDTVDKKAKEAIDAVQKQKEVDNPGGSSDYSSNSSGGDQNASGGSQEGTDEEADTGEDMSANDLGLDSGGDESGGAPSATTGESGAGDEETKTGSDLGSSDLGLDEPAKAEPAKAEATPAPAAAPATPAKEEAKPAEAKPAEEAPKEDKETKTGKDVKNEDLGLDKSTAEKREDTSKKEETDTGKDLDMSELGMDKEEKPKEDKETKTGTDVKKEELGLDKEEKKK